MFSTCRSREASGAAISSAVNDPRKATLTVCKAGQFCQLFLRADGHPDVAGDVREDFAGVFVAVEAVPGIRQCPCHVDVGAEPLYHRQSGITADEFGSSDDGF